ncbi:MAG: UPF0104 family protein [Planctomycetota bacterium]|nr:MAG: UPF0104 family protein [Planctomycetota bacterium]
MKKKYFLFLLKILLALFFLIYLFQTNKLDFKRVGTAFSQWGWVVTAFFLIGISISISIFRWQLLLRAQGIRIPYFKVLKLSFIGFFFNIFMPGAVGGDFIKAYYIAKKQEKKKTAAVTSVFVDRLVGLFSLLLLAALFVLGNIDFFLSQKKFQIFLFSLFIVVGVALLCGLIFLFFPLPFQEKDIRHFSLLKRILYQIYESIHGYQRKSIYLIIGILLSLVAHILTVTACYGLGQALGESQIQWGLYYSLFPVGMVIQAIPISFGSWGFGEMIFQSLFDLAHPLGEKSQGANICFLWHLLLTLWNLLGIVFYLEEKAEVDRLIEVEESLSPS